MKLLKILNQELYFISVDLIVKIGDCTFTVDTRLPKSKKVHLVST